MRIYAWAKNYKHSFISLSPIFTGLSCLVLVFTAPHGMQTRSCDENSVRPSVCPSVRQTRAL